MVFTRFSNVSSEKFDVMKPGIVFELEVGYKVFFVAAFGYRETLRVLPFLSVLSHVSFWYYFSMSDAGTFKYGWGCGGISVLRVDLPFRFPLVPYVGKSKEILVFCFLVGGEVFFA